MHNFQQLVKEFGDFFAVRHFPASPATLYEPGEYFLSWGGKRIRPVLCLMGQELFSDITDDAWQAATAIELFHNFTLIHDDMMDAAALRRGNETVHMKYGTNTALLAGDVMLIQAYDHLSRVHARQLPALLTLFNRTAREVCEGQQLDIDFERSTEVQLDAYIHMITLKTSVLLAASLQMGAMLGGASEGNCEHLYAFGKNLGIAFQIQDDYLDAFGDPEKFGKEVGGDIRQNKKTFLLLHALEVASPSQKKELLELMQQNPSDKVARVLDIFRSCGVEAWANELKEKYWQLSLQHLESIAVLSNRKQPLLELARYLLQREH
ncbi:MAG: polyprenyl synthetase family protein [Bacteroidota bacterium]|jgi:geranylgeranyl diphosphate synthase type II